MADAPGHSGEVRRWASRRFGVAVVRGRSMEPTLSGGDRLLVVYGAAPRPGRVLLVRLPDGVLAVKRAALRVEEGWWVECDNRREGVDSWRVGAIAAADVVAVAVVRVWPRPARLGRGSATARRHGVARG